MAKVQVGLFGSTAKDLQRPDLNEDAWLASAASQRWALSDGASESYDSRTWARALVQRYVQDPRVNDGVIWVEQLVEDYAHSVDFASLSWAQQAAYDRGSFATLLGIELAENGTDLEVLAIGDSLAVHVRSGQLLASFPFQTAAEFLQRPQLLSTLTAANAFVRASDFMSRHSAPTWSVEAGDHVYLMTDAVGQWLLEELGAEPGSLAVLERLADAQEFDDLVVSLRRERRMKLDDSTLVRLVVHE